MFWAHSCPSLSIQSAGSTQFWKVIRLRFGRSYSVAGGVRKLGLGVSGTPGVISARSSGVAGTDSQGGVVLTGRL